MLMFPDPFEKFEAVALLEPVCSIVKFRVNVHVWFDSFSFSRQRQQVPETRSALLLFQRKYFLQPNLYTEQEAGDV
jgi:hypothetical protein